MPEKERNTRGNPKKMGYQDMPLGGLITEAGSSVKYKAGEWKSKYPDINKDKCSECLLCYIYCPENCIELENTSVKSIDLDYCKGCGICAVECPKNAIEMKQE